MKSNETFLSNIIYAFGSQIISLSLSILMSLLLPKILGLTDYSYFQLFLFYSSYSGFALLGLNDGIYLREGGKEWLKIDRKLIGNQWKISFASQLLIGFFIIIFVIFSKGSDNDRNFVIIFFCLYMIVFNTWGFFSYIFQATNQTKIYSKSIMIDRLLFLVFLLLLIFFNKSSFKIYIVFYTISKLLSTLYCMNIGRELVFAKRQSFKKVLLEMFLNMKIGINLMFANIASMLILGSGRFIVDLQWGISAFGKFSFSLSLTNFFLQFISQVSMVLFPTLRQSSNEEQRNIFTLINDLLFIILPLVYVLYTPIYLLLIEWLPQYKESLHYLILLLPICMFDGKMSLLYSTYFKVLRLEKKLLYVNLIAMIFSLIASAVAAFILDDIIIVIITMVISISLRSIISSLIINKKIFSKHNPDIYIELIISIIFMYVTWNLSLSLSCTVMISIYILLLCFKRKKITNLICFLKR